tara:strand:- start:65 stop:433 length:369 start_codon:yes stop_codon:yes gene_type:complete
MKLKTFITVLSLFFTTSLIAEDKIKENLIHKNLRCLVCQGQSIADSNSDFAITLKMVVKDLIQQGKTEDEIYSFLSDKYGDWILYKPKLNLGNILLWSLPYLVLIVGGIIIVLLVRKGSKKA